MAQIAFTPNLSRHLDCPSLAVDGSTVAEVLSALCAAHTQLRSYLLDDQDRLRKHVTVFVDNVQIKVRIGLSDTVQESSSVYIAQALSGG